MALSGLSALISTSTAEPPSSAALSAESALSVLASINYSALGSPSTHLAPGNERNSTLSSSATFSVDGHSSAGMPDSMDDSDDEEDDIAGLLHLTQAAAHMRPTKKPAPERPQKVPSIRLKAKKELKVKAKIAPAPKSKSSKALKPAKSPKSKPTSARRPAEPTLSARAAEKEKPFEMEASMESDGEGGPQIEVEEFQTIFQSIAKESELATRDLRKSKSGSVEVYGEVLPAFVESLREALALNSSDVFFDLGSGIGNVVCQIASQVGCRCYGVEIRSDLHAIAEAVLVRLRNQMNLRGFRMGTIQLTNADALTQPMLLVDTTVVFLNNMGFPESMQGPLEHFFTETLPHGSRLVTLRELFPRLGPSSFENKRFSRSFATLFKHPCESFEAAPGSVTWTNEPVKVYIYTVDREAWAAVTYAINRPNNMMTSSIDSLRASSNSTARGDKSSPKPKKSGLHASSPGLPASSISSQAPNTPYSPSPNNSNHNDTTDDASITGASTQSSSANDLPQLTQNILNPKGMNISPQAHYSLAGNNAQYLQALKCFESSLMPVVSCSESPISSFGRTGQLHIPKQGDFSLIPPTSLSAALSSQEVFGQINIDFDFALECSKSSTSWRGGLGADFSTTHSRRASARSIALNHLIGCDLANPLVPIDTLMERLAEHHSRQPSHCVGNWTEFDGLYEVHRDYDSAILDIDREKRVEVKRIRVERAAKLTEISNIATEAQALDSDWQREWLEVERLRTELAEMEEKLETLAKKRHTAVYSLTNLLEDESEETLASLSLKLVVESKDSQDLEDDTAESSLPKETTGNEMEISEPTVDEAAANASSESATSDPQGAMAQLQAFLDGAKQFMDDNGIEMPVMKKSSKAKLDKRFGPRPKKSAVKSSPRPPIRSSTDAAPETTESAEVVDSASSMQVDEPQPHSLEDEETPKVQHISSNDHGRGERPRGSRHSERLSASSSAVAAAAAVERHQVTAVSTPPSSTKKSDTGPPPTSNGSELILRLPGEHFLRFTRPKRALTQASPSAEPSKRVKRPGQKSLDRKQLKTALTSALSGSPDGKLSIVELRQACKDLTPFKDLREKQIERKVWDALSKAQDQFKHALPTPTERKAHAMGAGKAGLWSINPKWRRTASYSALEASGQLFLGNGSSSSSATSTGFGSNSDDAELAAVNALSAAAEEYDDDDFDSDESSDMDGDDDAEIDDADLDMLIDSSAEEDDLDEAQEENGEDFHENLSDAEPTHADPSNAEPASESPLPVSDIADPAVETVEKTPVPAIVEAAPSSDPIAIHIDEATEDGIAALLGASLASAPLATETAMVISESDTVIASVVEEAPQPVQEPSSTDNHGEVEDFVVEEAAEPEEVVPLVQPLPPANDPLPAEVPAPTQEPSETIPSSELTTTATLTQDESKLQDDLDDPLLANVNSRKRTRLDLESQQNHSEAPTLTAAAEEAAAEELPPAKRFAPPPSLTTTADEAVPTPHVLDPAVEAQDAVTTGDAPAEAETKTLSENPAESV